MFSIQLINTLVIGTWALAQSGPSPSRDIAAREQVRRVIRTMLDQRAQQFSGHVQIRGTIATLPTEDSAIDGGEVDLLIAFDTKQKLYRFDWNGPVQFEEIGIRQPGQCPITSRFVRTQEYTLHYLSHRIGEDFISSPLDIRADDINGEPILREFDPRVLGFGGLPTYRGTLKFITERKTSDEYLDGVRTCEDLADGTTHIEIMVGPMKEIRHRLVVDRLHGNTPILSETYIPAKIGQPPPAEPTERTETTWEEARPGIWVPRAFKFVSQQLRVKSATLTLTWDKVNSDLDPAKFQRYGLDLPPNTSTVITDYRSGKPVVVGRIGNGAFPPPAKRRVE